MSVAPLAAVTAAPPAQAVTSPGDVAPAAADAAAGNAVAAPATSTAPPTAAPPADPILQAVDVARAAAAGRQASLAPLLADLAQAVASPALSGQTKAAIAQVLALQTPVEGDFTAQVFKDAVAQSGLFLEAHLARLSPSGQAPPDLKAALLVLQRVLAAVPPSPAPAAPRPAVPAAPAGQSAPAVPTAPVASAPSLSPPASAATPAPAETPSTLPAQAAPTLAQTPPAAQIANEAVATPGVAPEVEPAPTMASEAASPQAGKVAVPAADLPARSAAPAPAPQSAPGAPLSQQTAGTATAAPTPSPAQAPTLQTSAAALIAAQSIEEAIPQTAPPPQPDLAPLAPPRDDLPLDARSALLFLQRAFGAAPAGRPGPASRAAAPPPPLRQSATGAQAAEPAALPAGDDEGAIAQHLAGETDSALARLTLHQLASLPDAAGGPAWVFELPLATPQGAAMAQFVIDRDEEAATGSTAGPAWRARFSIDVEPLGPVHIHLRVGRETSAVTLWAERDGGVERLRSQGAALAQALGAEVVIHPGAPNRSTPPPGPGQFVDQSS
jgi:hypothetical protein